MGVVVTSGGILAWLMSQEQLYIGLVVRPVYRRIFKIPEDLQEEAGDLGVYFSEPVELDAPWYERQPLDRGSEVWTYTAPDEMDETVKVLGLALFSAPEKGTGKMLLYYESDEGGLYVGPGYTLSMTTSNRE